MIYHPIPIVYFLPLPVNSNLPYCIPMTPTHTHHTLHTTTPPCPLAGLYL